MILADRLHTLRVAKDLSQGDIEHRTGLLRCYVSRVENGQTVPTIETLEKWARALEVPLYQLFYTGPTPPDAGNHQRLFDSLDPELDNRRGSHGRNARYLYKLRKSLAKMDDRERHMILLLAKQLARRHKKSFKYNLIDQ